MSTPLPNFIVIGPGRSGTTWLYNALREHPEIGMASTKETCYFDAFYHKGLGWYADFFKSYNGRKAIGEVSNTYIFSPLAARRIAELNPNIRIISPLRNPEHVENRALAVALP